MPVSLVVASEHGICCPRGIQPLQAARVWAGRAVSAIRSRTTAHTLVRKNSLPDAAFGFVHLCIQRFRTFAAGAPKVASGQRPMLSAGHPATASGTGVGGKGSLCYSFKDNRPPIGLRWRLPHFLADGPRWWLRLLLPIDCCGALPHYLAYRLRLWDPFSCRSLLLIHSTF